MKRFSMLFAAVLLMLGAVDVRAAGSVTATCSALGIGPLNLVTITWIGDASSGSVPSTAATCLRSALLQGYSISQAETVPGSPAPTNGYAVTLTDANGIDVAAGQWSALSGSAPAMWTITAPPLNGVLTLNVSGTSVASGTGKVYLWLAPGNYARSRGGGTSTGTGAANVTATAAGPATSLALTITSLRLTAIDTALLQCWTGTSTRVPLALTGFTTSGANPINTVTPTFSSSSNVTCAVNSNGGAGPTGAQGTQGATGAAGAAGATGPTGATGPMGAAGATGAAGAAGTNGTNGAISQIQVNGSTQTVRAKLNLKDGSGASLTVADNSGAGSTDVTVNASGSSSVFAGCDATGGSMTFTFAVSATSGSPCPVRINNKFDLIDTPITAVLSGTTDSGAAILYENRSMQRILAFSDTVMSTITCTGCSNSMISGAIDIDHIPEDSAVPLVYIPFASNTWGTPVLLITPASGGDVIEESAGLACAPGSTGTAVCGTDASVARFDSGTVTDGMTVTFDGGGLFYFNDKLTLTVHTGTRTVAVTGLVDGGQYQWYVKQDGTGGADLLSDNSTCTWIDLKTGTAGIPALTHTANITNLLSFTYDASTMKCLVAVSAGFTL